MTINRAIVITTDDAQKVILTWPEAWALARKLGPVTDPANHPSDDDLYTSPIGPLDNLGRTDLYLKLCEALTEEPQE
jgi:hypothetical protein